MKLISPKTDDEFRQYYHLRWRMLRQPWGQAEGTEQDKDDEHCYHIMAIKENTVCGVARLEFPANTSAQLRYMAVDSVYQHQGIGRKIVVHMERHAKNNNADELFLHARENAVSFYEKLGYKIIEKSYLLFNSIQHYKMAKALSAH